MTAVSRIQELLAEGNLVLRRADDEPLAESDLRRAHGILSAVLATESMKIRGHMKSRPGKSKDY
jgi:hypothetical protein